VACSSYLCYREFVESVNNILQGLVPQFDMSSRNLGSIQIVSPTLPLTDEMSSSAMPTSLNPAITNSRPMHLVNVEVCEKVWVVFQSFRNADYPHLRTNCHLTKTILHSIVNASCASSDAISKCPTSLNSLECLWACAPQAVSCRVREFEQ